MARRYRYIADKGEVPPETDEERLEREKSEAEELKAKEFQREQEERDARRVGAYL